MSNIWQILLLLELFTIIDCDPDPDPDPDSDSDSDLDLDPINYWVVYVYVYANDVIQLLFYNIQGSNLYDNKDVVCDKNVNLNFIVQIHIDKNEVEYTYLTYNDVHDCYNDDFSCSDYDANVDANCYHDDMNNGPSEHTYDCGNNNILFFYLLWKQVQLWVLDDNHNDVIIDHHASDNDHDIHVIHDTLRNNHNLVYKDNKCNNINPNNYDTNCDRYDRNHNTIRYL